MAFDFAVAGLEFAVFSTAGPSPPLQLLLLRLLPLFVAAAVPPMIGALEWTPCWPASALRPLPGALASDAVPENDAVAARTETAAPSTRTFCR